jgi:hypothetical protein
VRAKRWSLPSGTAAIFGALLIFAGVNVAAFARPEDALFSGLMFELGGALLAVPLTVFLIDELQKRRERTRRRRERQNAMVSILRELALFAAIAASVNPSAADQITVQALAELGPLEEDMHTLKLLRSGLQTHRAAITTAAVLAAVSLAEPRFMRISDVLAPRVYDTADAADDSSAALQRLERSWRHLRVGLIDQSQEGRTIDRFFEVLEDATAAFRALARAVEEHSSSGVEQASTPEENGVIIGGWEVEWRPTEPDEIPATYSFVGSEGASRIVLFERGDPPWDYHANALKSLSWEHEQPVFVGIVTNGKFDPTGVEGADAALSEFVRTRVPVSHRSGHTNSR